jgi:hypothetical protein
MNLTLGVIIDGFSEYNPIVHRISDKKAQIRGLCHYSTEFTETDPDYLYISDTKKAVKALGENCPKHIIIAGGVASDGLRPYPTGMAPGSGSIYEDKPGLPGKPGLQSNPNLFDKADTVIQIPDGISVEALFKTGSELFASREAWYNSLLMAVINHKPIGVFLEIAAQGMANPIVVFNNNLSAISSAGSVTGPVEGTNWEIVNIPGFVLDNFYTPQELRKISSHIAQKSEQILVVNPKNDPAHSSLGILIWIDGKLYGGIGTVDMNKPFTEGQKETFLVVAQVLKLYFQNHSIYMRIAENKVNWLDSLLDGAEIPEDIISNYLGRFQWRINDSFCIVTFTVFADVNIPIVSILDFKQINDLFPDALVSVYGEHIVMVIRCPDKQQLHGKKKEQLEQLLKKDIMLCCGVSMVFSNFLHLRYYHTQSKFAASQCKPQLGMAICFYDDCQTDHIMQTLSHGADLRCFCHPAIALLWESGEESDRELVNCLYHYFLNGRNISAAAGAIHVHRNTLIYRLAKAAEVLNIDLKHTSPKQAFLFIISCLIVQQL